jgi:two-component system nitrogen regulation sensor histidine kinase NtrY
LKKPRLWLLLALPVLCVLAGLALEYRESGSQDVVLVAKTASGQLAELEAKSSEFLKELSITRQQRKPGESIRLSKPRDLTALIFDGDSLLWWSGTGVEPLQALAALKSGEPLIKTGNGWYRVFTVPYGKRLIAGFLRIRSEYPFQNKYLVNSFHQDLCIPEQFQFSVDPDQGHAVSGTNNTPLFYISAAPVNDNRAPWSLTAVAYMLAIVLFHYFIFRLVQFKSGSSALAWFITGLTVLISRFAGAQSGFPEALHVLPFFSPSYYASSLLLNSLADLFAFSVALVFCAAGYFQWMRLRQPDSGKAGFGITLWVLFALLFSVFINHLVSTLIINSKISFNITNVFELDYFTLAGVLIIGLLLLSLTLVILTVAGRMTWQGAYRNQAMLFSLAALAIFMGFRVLVPDFPMFPVFGWEALLLTLFLFAVALTIERNKLLFANAGITLLVIAGFSMYAAVTVSKLNGAREKNERKLIATKLENEQDGIAEYLFEDIAGKIRKDTMLRDYFSAPFREQLLSYAAEDPIARRLQQVYFTGYWARYDILVKCFSNDGLPVNAGGDPTWNLDYFNLLINEESIPTQSRHLYFLGNNAGQLTYLARLEIGETVNDSLRTSGGTIVLLFKSKILRDDSGFPELLISDKVPKKKDLSAYSFANYKDNLLLNQSGKFNYLNNGSRYAAMASGQELFFDLEGYSHLLYKKSGGGFLMVSTVTPGLLEYITLFSYIFAFFGTIYIIDFFVTRLVLFRGRIRLNFKNRIQTTVMLIVLTGMLLMGGATVYFIHTNYVNNLNDAVTEKLKSVRVSISDLVGMRSQDQQVGEELGYALSGVASTLSANFNIYTTSGRLAYSSQPKIYEEGIAAPLMDRKAMDELQVNGKSFHTRLEKTGNLRYLSAYEQLRNYDNHVIGFINLPYYARQDELNREISSFLVALINIYVLLFSVSLLFAFVISARITRPLEVIQQSLARIRLGARNEPIRWEHADEIGALVREYNRMVDELAESANRLARSERESAWREMAKQVAHEIKNPLTPMKLSVQHLQRSYKENHPNLEQMVQRVSETLISQIETLTNIANEFAGFAQMPKGNNEELDLNQVVKTITDLYRESENTTVTFNLPHETYRVFADKDQLSRVFSNLLKNAVQSIPEQTSGKITVSMYADEQSVIVSVSDNGIGIPEDRKASLFTPNFTTKTGGTGLGLAMSKNIVEQSGGTIWFESEEGKGSVFYVRLPFIKTVDG